MLDTLCKNCGLIVNTFVKNCQKLSTITDQQNISPTLLWTTFEKYQFFHKTIHIVKTYFLSEIAILSTLPTGPITTTNYKKGTL